ncbi:amino acid transporter [Nitzschia inconspicua]|uniref:Amino acid transporter n=1 Tax=Nitzschia inconspicua TaxID=303405 RepID=A0A9K3KBZ8_9STRA|nr:amino acid transporter [Nitzschia inconspicua]
MTQPTQTPSPYSYQSLSTAITRRRPLHRQKQQSNTTSMNEASQAENQRLKRTLSLTDLIFYGVSCSVGAGIYSLVGIGANLAGPGIALSFALCGVACIFTSLGYAEFAARVPLAGSAYTFTYVSFGELCGWLVGWNLTLGYAVSASVVARSWAAYLVGFVQGMLHATEINVGDDGDQTITSMPKVSKFLHWSIHAPLPNLFSTRDDSAIDNATITNSYECCPLAMLIIILCTLVLLTGAKESSRFNSAMTILNLSILGFVILVGTVSGTAFQVDNLTPVLPHGWQGVGRAAGLVFFSYLGFDMVSCLSEEVEHPERNMPIGIIGSLLTSMLIYCMVSIVVVGLAPVMLLGEDIPIVNALLANACCTHDEQVSAASLDDATLRQDACLNYACKPILHSMLYIVSRIVSFGAIFGLTTACFACLMGQPRIFFSMAQDGLLFKIYAKVNPKTGVPTMGTILTGVFTALVACFIDLESLANAISLGTLQVFTFVNAGVIILRMTPPVKSWPGGSLVLDGGSERWDLVRTQYQKQRQRHQDERTPLLPDHGGAEIVIDSTRKAQLEMNFLSGDPAGSTSSYVYMSMCPHHPSLGHPLQFIHDGFITPFHMVCDFLMAAGWYLLLLWIWNASFGTAAFGSPKLCKSNPPGEPNDGA